MENRRKTFWGIAVLVLFLVYSSRNEKDLEPEDRFLPTTSMRQIEDGDKQVLLMEASTCTPKGIHLAQRSDVDSNGRVSMTVSFYLPFLACQDARPSVLYGLKGQEQSALVAPLVPEPVFKKYASRRTDGRTFLSDYIYHVEVPNLQAGNVEYWYQIDVAEALHNEDESNEQDKRETQTSFSSTFIGSPIKRFRTPPMPGTLTSIAIIADLGNTYISRRTVQGIYEASKQENEQYPISSTIVAGDIAYADGEPWL